MRLTIESNKIIKITRGIVSSPVIKCKFNLPAEQICGIIEGAVNNEHGISRYCAPKGEGMLLGDVVCDFVKRTGKKLGYSTGCCI